MKTQPFALCALAFACAHAYADTMPEYRGEEVVVTATRQATPIHKVLSDVTVIYAEEIARAGAQDLPTLLSRTSGVEVSSNGGPGQTASVFLRGAEADHTLVLVDGMRIVSATDGSTALQHIPLAEIERIEILRGPASSLYGGDAIGGVIQVFTRQGRGAPRFSVSAGAGSHDRRQVSANVSGQVDNTSFSLTASHDKTHGFSATNANNAFAFDPDADGNQNNAYSARIAQQWAPGHTVSANLFQTFATTDYDGGLDNTRPDEVHQRLTGQSIESRDAFTEAWTSTLRFARTQDKYENYTDGDFALRDSLFKTTQDEWTWQNDVKSEIGTWLAGASYVKQAVDTSSALTAKDRTIKSVFGGYQGEFGDWLTQVNLRRDENSQFGGKTTGSANLGWRFAQGWLASVGYGTAFKAPTFNDLYFPFTDFGFGFTYQGNPNLKPETSKQWEAALGYRQGDSAAKLVVFDNRIDNLIVGNADFSSVNNLNRAKIQGATLSGETRFGALSLEASATWQSPEDADSGKQLQRRTRRHASLKASYAVIEPLTVGAEVRVQGHRYSDPANTQRLDGYGVTNLFAQYAIDRSWTLDARVDNVGDKEYELARGFNTPRREYFLGVRYASK
ncbi:TonB-dependent receptor domain-containing protein [Crenobacter cavernae]|nr:TonB-dependent receptor [Crenobacter cavernae]